MPRRNREGGETIEATADIARINCVSPPQHETSSTSSAMDSDSNRAGDNNPTSGNVLGKRDRPSGSDSSPPDKTPTKWFRCADCDRSYSRIDHLARHVRQHTQERPYVCEQCHKGFARADLLKRHASVHSAPDGGSSRKPNRQGRVNQACVACAELHLKCDNEKPCTRCKSKNLYCQYQTRQADDEAVAHDLLSLSQQPVQTPDYGRVEPQTPITHGVRFVQDVVIPGSSTSNQLNVQPQSHPGMQAPAMESGYPAIPNDFDGNELRDFLQNVMGPQSTTTASQFQSGAWTPRNFIDLGFDTDLELNDIDRDLLADYSLNNPFGVTPDTSGSIDSGEVGSEPPVGGVEPIQKASTWRFRPASRDNRDNNLSLPSGTTRRLVIARRITKEPLSYVTRDAIMGLVTAARYRPLNPGTHSALPSVELLDSLLQFYLASVPPSDQFLHTPTYDPIKARPELTCGLLAAGAVLTPDKHLRKLGFALQEAVRGAIATALESDNTLIRSVEILQAGYLNLTIGLWSGNSRKMELAEAFQLVFTTMMRRGGWFRRSYEHHMPHPNDQGEVLEAKWHAWVEEETKKRIVFFVFQHDSQASASLHINPAISYSELHLPLPYPQGLWTAKSAQAWKDLYLSNYTKLPSQPPSVIDILRRVDQFGSSQSIVDDRVAVRALMCASWGLVHEYRQQNVIQQGMQSHWSGGSLLLSSRLSEIKQLLECLRMSGPSSADTSLFLELQNLHLHMSLEDVHVFAGLEGQDEARRVYPALVDWVRTPSARHAIWHAGQIVRYAAQIPFIRNFEATGVYQAGLALWSYGVISNANTFHSPEMVPMGRAGEEFVAVNGAESQAAQRFLTLNRGVPGLAGPSTGGHDQVMLSDPSSMMIRLIELLRSSHRSTNSVPPLVENLVDLLGSLGAAVSNERNGSRRQA